MVKEKGRDKYATLLLEIIESSEDAFTISNIIEKAKRVRSVSESTVRSTLKYLHMMGKIKIEGGGVAKDGIKQHQIKIIKRVCYG